MGERAMSFADDMDGDAPDQAPSHGSRNLLAVIWQRKALVILGALLGLVAGFLFYWQRAPVYQSTAQVLVIKKRSDPLPVAGGDPRLAYVDDYMGTHLVLLRSPLIIDRAVKKRDLASMKSFENSGDPVAQLLGSLAVTRDSAKDTTAGPNNIIHLAFRGPIAEDCGKVLAAVIDSYQEFLDITYKNVSDNTVDLITRAREVLKKDLKESEDKYQKFRLEAPIFWKSKDGVNMQLERVASLETKKSTILVRQSELRARLEFLEKNIKEGRGNETLLLVQRANQGKMSPAEKVFQDQLLPLLMQEQKLLETYGEDHPQVKSARASIALLRDFYKDTITSAEEASKNPVELYRHLMRDEYQENEMILTSLGKVLDGLKNEARDLTNYEIQEDHLRGDVARTTLIYEGTLKRLSEINLVRDSGGFDARQLSQSGTGVKVAPSAFQTIVGGLLLGMLVGVGLAFLADFSDHSFRNPDEVRRRLGLPLLGHIPFLKADADTTRLVAAGEIVLDPLLFALFRPKSLESEAYRAVRTALYFSTQGEGNRVLQVTSPNKGDGKSLLLSNLAISMAQSGKKVLIIDADCRRPRQHKIFHLPNAQGLATVIAQGLNWKDAIQPTPIDGLFVMPSGIIPPNPSELLTSPAFKTLLETTRADFDFVLVDTPPLLAVTDPCVVAGRVDGLVLVLRLTRQGRPHAERAREILKSMGVKIFGIVVNGVVRQGKVGLYSSEHYDYTESYEEAGQADDADGYYYADEDADKPPHDNLDSLAAAHKASSEPPGKLFSKNL
jgi:succinoglycan biosynthesis transport protein ExoP